MKTKFLVLFLLLSVHGISTPSILLGKWHENKVFLRWLPLETRFASEHLRQGVHLFRIQSGKETYLSRLAALDENHVVWKNGDNRMVMMHQWLYSQQTMDEQSPVHGLMLLSADTDPGLADAIGSRFVDSLFDPGVDPEYVIRDRSGKDLARVKISFSKKEFIEQAESPQWTCLNGAVDLFWTGKTSNRMASWSVERSLDGKTWKQINSYPIVPFFTEENPDRNLHYYDTIPKDEIMYYRIRGRDAFGIWTHWSKEIAVRCFAIPNPLPALSMMAYGKDSVLLDIVYFAEEDRAKLKKVIVESSRKYLGPYQSVGEYSPLDFPVKHLQEHRGIYYKTRWIFFPDEERSSFPEPFFLKDAGPPLPPSYIHAAMDSNGMVHAIWRSGCEKDIRGYRFYTRNAQHEEWIERSAELIHDTVFRWQTHSDGLDGYVEVAVAATDSSWNTSELSQPFRVKRPDRIPPAVPVWKSVLRDQDSLYFSYAADTSAERQLWVFVNDTAYALVLQEGNEGSLPLQSGKQKILIRSIDDSGNSSESDMLVLDLPAREKKPEFILSKGQQQIVIRYAWQGADLYRLAVYRKEEGDEWKSVIVLHRSFGEWCDRDLKMNTTYRYKIKVQMNSGKELWSDEQQIAY